jgi:hypothetical protein
LPFQISNGDLLIFWYDFNLGNRNHLPHPVAMGVGSVGSLEPLGLPLVSWPNFGPCLKKKKKVFGIRVKHKGYEFLRILLTGALMKMLKEY